VRVFPLAGAAPAANDLLTMWRAAADALRE
jgi:hypothetical protein